MTSEGQTGTREGPNVKERGTALEISQPKRGTQPTPQGASRPEVGVKPRRTAGGQSTGAATTSEGTPGDPGALMEQVVARTNMRAALRRVEPTERELRALGLPEGQAESGARTRKGYWRMACGPLSRALDTAYWRRQGLTSLAERLGELMAS